MDGDVKKFCPSCRYNKCVHVGMKPDLVLKEDEISERFKYQRNFRKRIQLTHNFQPGFTSENSEEVQEPRSSHSDTQEPPISGSGSSGSVSFSPNQLSDFQRISVIIRNPHLKGEKDNSDDTGIPESDQIEKDIFGPRETRNEDEAEADSLILHYTHKKFRKLLLSKQNYKEIEELSDKSQYPVVTSLSNVYKNNYLTSENINDLDNNFLQEMNQTFTKAFGAVNLGETVMSSYIDFCIRKTNGDLDLSLDPSFYSNCNQQITSKFLNFVSEFDFINLSSRKFYRILHSNLPTTKSLFYVYQYNNSNVEEELKLGCGELDLIQWQECPNKPQGVGFSEMVTYINMESTAKLGLIRCLIELWQPIFRDKTVFILTFLLGLLDMEDDDEVRQLRQTVLFILQRYLKGKNYSDEDMKSVGFILSRLPYLTKLVT